MQMPVMKQVLDAMSAFADRVLTRRAAARGGAEVLTLCDTNGGSMPWQVEAIVAEIPEKEPAGGARLPAPACTAPVHVNALPPDTCGACPC